MQKNNFTKKIALLSALLCIIAMHASAQVLTVSNYVNGHYSDFYVQTSWTAMPTNGGFECGNGTSYAHGGSTHHGTDYFNFANPALPAGSHIDSVGPDVYRNYDVEIQYTGTNPNGCGVCDCCNSAGCNTSSGNSYEYSDGWSIYTDYIHSPVNVSASAGNSTTSPNLVTITWGKGSDIPDGSRLQYKVYRGTEYLATLPSGTYSYIDSTVLPTGSYSYEVTSYTSGGSTWSAQESYQAYGYVSVSNELLHASDGTYYNKTALSWINIAGFAPNDITVSRNGVQLAVVNKNSTTYNDFDGVPGVTYTYSISPIDANNASPFTFTNTGFSRPNGVIKGNVTTPFNSSVPGVTLVAYANVDGNTSIVDSVVTDASGFYQFNDLFYDTSAVYTLVPHKGSHHFNPDTLTRTLGLNDNVASGVNFIDTSVFTIEGKVQFYTNAYCPAGCFPQGVSMYVNGAPVNSVTDGAGNFKITIQQEGTYTFTPVLKDHIFSPASITTNITADYFNLNFTDSTTDILSISLHGGCGNQVAYRGIVVINDSNGYFRLPNVNNFDTIYGKNYQNLVVPAQVYHVRFYEADKYIAGTNTLTYDPLIPMAFPLSLRADLSKRDSGTITHQDTTIVSVPVRYINLINGRVDTIAAHIDTTITTDSSAIRIWDKIDFVYHGDVQMSVPDFPLYPLASGCSLNNGYIMTQGTPERIRVYINEYYYYDSTTCPVDSGQMRVYDDVSDLSAPQTSNFYRGKFDYTIFPGAPHIAPPYTKLLQFFATVGNSTSTWPSGSQQIIVLGTQPHTATFVTKTPELPLYVLHDPPGDASYSFLERDSTVTTTFSNSYQVGGSAGVYASIKTAVETPVPLTGLILGAGVGLSADLTFGGNYSNSGNYTSTFTATQQFATSGSSDFVGSGGDIFVGASFNQIYSLADVIELSGCGIKDSIQLTMSPTGVATTYMYTEQHILNTILPQLDTLYSILSRGTAAQKDSALLYATYIEAWQNVMSVNRKNRDTLATFQRNISFSAGAPYDNTISTNTDTSIAIGYSLFLDANVAAELFAGDLSTGKNETDIGVKVNFNWNMNNTTTNDVNQTKTTGYHLEDSNPGDFFSVDIKKDRVYGTPSFAIVAGTSSCPHEAGTQARDSVNLSINTHDIHDVPVNQAAVFTASILNESESLESRTYSIAAVPESNPDGAIIKIGGQQINNSSANFTVPYGQALPVTLTVEAGPTAADYQNLKVSAFSPCDGGEGNTITFEAHFQSSCSPIGLFTPSDNWLVNASMHDTLPIIFSGYNINDSLLVSVGLQYHTTGSGWLPVVDFSRAHLLSNNGSQYYTYVFNTAALPDGAYQIRAYANCGSGQGEVTYSPILSGTISRNSLSLFGTPSPADGILDINQNISVSFNGAVDCNQAAVYNTPIYATLTRADNGQVIPDSVTCNGNQLIIYTNPPSLIDSLENVTLTATVNDVYDMFGNSLKDPIIWSFMVSRSNVYWNPSSMSISAQTGMSTTVTATMNNVGASADSFTIIHMPSWLSTPQVVNYQIAGASPAAAHLDVNFTSSASLNPGTYTDTVVALASGKRVYLFVTLHVGKIGPHWTVNPANYQYSMNITANYSTTQLNTPLSTDTRDTIALFKGNECRGFAGISYDPSSNKYVAFITAYSNSVVGDTFTFRMWDADPGIEYQAVERLPFVNDGSIGQALAPYILHPAGAFQTIALRAGWNWFSLNVKSADMTPNTVLSSIHGNNGAIVKTQDIYSQYTTSTVGWQGALAAFNINKSYMIQLDHADTLHYLGQLVVDSSIVAISSGWNWIGFPRQKISSDTAFLRNLTNLADSDLLKSQSQFAQYDGTTWSGSLNYLYPGQGYKIKTANSFNFVIPPDRSLPVWSVNKTQFQQNQSVTADLQFDAVSTTQSHYLVGAFANGICVGTAQPQYISALGIYRVFITVQGDATNAGQSVTYKVYDTDNDIEFTPTYAAMSVAPDSSVGTVESPYVINVQTTTGINALTYTDGFSLLQNVPNPFSRTTSIQYAIPSAQNVTITLYDESGRLIRELTNGTQPVGSHTVSFEQDNLQTGVYFYQMKSGEFVKTRRMMIIQ